MALQIKGKFIQSEAIDGSKLKLKQGEALRAVDENGVDIEPVLMRGVRMRSSW